MRPAPPSTYPHYGPRERRILLALDVAIGVCAIVGGIGLIGGWVGIGTSNLQGSLFDSYLIPGLLLSILVGGALLTAAYLVWSRSAIALQGSLTAGFALLGWITAGIWQIGMASWLQPLMGVAGVLIAVTAVHFSRR
jgi:hypothetical protein